MMCGGYYEMIFIYLHVSVVNSTNTHNKTETSNNTIGGRTGQRRKTSKHENKVWFKAKENK